MACTSCHKSGTVSGNDPFVCGVHVACALVNISSCIVKDIHETSWMSKALQVQHAQRIWCTHLSTMQCLKTMIYTPRAYVVICIVPTKCRKETKAACFPERTTFIEPGQSKNQYLKKTAQQ